jgi:hypothetical protein
MVSADLRGYLGPCGCTEAMRGGIDRAAYQLAVARKSGHPVLYLDGGDALFGTLSFTEAEIPQQERKAEAIAEAFRAMRLSTRATGELDDARGRAFRRSLGLPDLEKGTARVFLQNGVQVGVVAAETDPELLEGSRRARQQGADFVVALLHRSVEGAQQIASDPSLQANLIFATHRANELAGEENLLIRTPVPVAEIQSKGRSLATVEIFARGKGEKFELQRTEQEAERSLSVLSERIELLKRELNQWELAEEIKALKREKLAQLVQRRETAASAVSAPSPDRNGFAVRFIPLESTLPSEPEVKAIVSNYQREVGLLNLAWAKAHGGDCAPPTKGEAGFVGNESCRDCHAEAFPVWEKSSHARAYRTLTDLGRQYDLTCIGCHVTGNGRPGGVCRIDKVQGRENVGCESCHGPGSLHLGAPEENKLLAKPARADCVRCHDPENSPHFEWVRYLPQILGPGHGAKIAGERAQH